MERISAQIKEVLLQLSNKNKDFFITQQLCSAKTYEEIQMILQWQGTLTPHHTSNIHLDDQDGHTWIDVCYLWFNDEESSVILQCELTKEGQLYVIGLEA